MAEQKLNDKQYWKDRHTSVDDLKASGLQSVGLGANRLIYKILEDQYQKLLNLIELKSVKTILDCGFGDGYFLDFFVKNFPDKEISGIDISPAAKKKIKSVSQSRLYVGDLADFNLKKKFNIVHCFDVLYHILDDADYARALGNLSSHSDKFVILHERFLIKEPLIQSKHVRLRRREVTDQILNSNGFYLTREIPTHFVAVRTLTFRLNRLFAKQLYGIDKYIAGKLSDNVQERLASHFIRVYRKAGR